MDAQPLGRPRLDAQSLGRPRSRSRSRLPCQGDMLAAVRFPTGLTTTVRYYRNSCASCGAVVRRRDFYQGKHTPLKSGCFYYVDMVWRNKQGVQEGSICKRCGGDADQNTKGHQNTEDAKVCLPRFQVP